MPGAIELPGFNFVNMAMPQRFFIFRQRTEKLCADDVFDAHHFGVFDIAVEDDALNDIVIQDGAIVMGLHLMLRTSVIKVKAIHVRADGSHWGLVLQQRCTGF